MYAPTRRLRFVSCPFTLRSRCGGLAPSSEVGVLATSVDALRAKISKPLSGSWRHLWTNARRLLPSIGGSQARAGIQVLQGKEPVPGKMPEASVARRCPCVQGQPACTQVRRPSLLARRWRAVQRSRRPHACHARRCPSVQAQT